MAEKKIDLGKKGPAPSAEELRQRATGGKPPPPAAVPQLPRTANQVHGVTGNPPLPVGQPVRIEKGVRKTVSLTDLEKRILQQIGWRDGDPIPNNLADILAPYQKDLAEASRRAQEEVTHNLPLPVSPSHPPLKVETIDIAKLDPVKRAEIQAGVHRAVSDDQARQAAERAAERMARLPEDVQRAAAQAQAAALRQEPADVAVDVDDLALYDELQSKLPESEKLTPQKEAQLRQKTAASSPGAINLGGRKAPVPPPAPAPVPEPVQDSVPDQSGEASEDVPVTEAPVEAPQEEPQGDTGATQVMTECPHCGFDLARTDVPEPEYAEKMAFLHSVLGLKSYLKVYELFGGAMIVGFRTLTLKEMDAVFHVVMSERNEGKITNQLEFWERANRLRMYLQLSSLRASDLNFNMPDGLHRDLAPHASSYWEDQGMPDRDGPGDYGIKHVESWLLDNVLRTETLVRVVNLECNHFNRLVSKLEAMVDNSDFWRPTEAPS